MSKDSKRAHPFHTTYDNMGRPIEGKSGGEARGLTVPSTEVPYRQTYQYTAFDNMTQRNNLHWGFSTYNGESNDLSYTYVDNRITNTNWEHDDDGRVLKGVLPNGDTTPDEEIIWNAAGKVHKYTYIDRSRLERFYSGNGREIKRKSANWDSVSLQWVDKPTEYFIRSSILGGQIITEVKSTGKKGKTNVYAAGATLAWQTINHSTSTEYITFLQSDASGMSHRTTFTDGDAATEEGGEGAPSELDPMGGNVGLSSPYTAGGGPFQPEIPTLQPHSDWDYQIVNGQRVPCQMDGATIGCGMIGSRFSPFGGSDAYAACPDNICGPAFISINGQTHISSGYRAGNDGTFGYNYYTEVTSDAENITVLGDDVEEQGEVTGDSDRGWVSEFVEISYASWLPQKQTKKRKPKLGEGIPENLKELVLGLFNYKNCGETFEKLIQTSGKRFRKWQRRSQKSGKSILETIYDSLKSVKIDNKISTHAQNGGGDVAFKDNYNTDSRGVFFVWQRFALATIQELIHQVFNDPKLQEASVKLYQSGNLNPSVKAKVDAYLKEYNTAPKDIYQHTILSQACSIPDSELQDAQNNFESALQNWRFRLTH